MAAIVADPVLFAVTFPFFDTVAIALLLLTHLTVFLAPISFKVYDSPTFKVLLVLFKRGVAALLFIGSKSAISVKRHKK